MLEAFLLTVLIVIVAKAIAWLLQWRSGNAGVVDAIWSWTLGGLAVVYALAGDAPPALRILAGVMGGLWGLRLGTHIWRRNAGKPEDFRYKKFRDDWGARANFNMFWFFQFQNLFTLILSASAFLALSFRDTMPATGACVAAVVIWLIAVLGEGIADRQMEAFRADPANRGQVCRRGLWKWSRHPNYFFECVHWLAYVPLALGAPFGWTSLIAPLVMAWLLTRLSGMPLLEAEMMRRKPGYAEYVRTTSALVPWPPKPTSRSD
ncbi:DUF1295 domain-containing protein [Solimonas marina]|nr:DUF1295 domain-containing protein [Solimonas marina]